VYEHAPTLLPVNCESGGEDLGRVHVTVLSLFPSALGPRRSIYCTSVYVGNAAPNRDSQNSFRQRNQVIRYRDCCKFGQLSIVISPLQQLVGGQKGFKIKKRSFVEQAPMV
jgi:hypothetical protein